MRLRHTLIASAVALGLASATARPAMAEPRPQPTERLTAAATVARAAFLRQGELLGNGWRETDDGVVHCSEAANQIVCDRIGPGGAWYAQGVINLYWPWYCPPVSFVGGWQGGPRAVLTMGGNTGGVGCGLGVYPSTTQAFAAVLPWGKDAYEGLLELRPYGTNGGGPGVELNAVDVCGSPGCPSSTRQLQIIIG